MLSTLKKHEKLIGKLLIGAALATFLVSLTFFGIDLVWPGVLPERLVPRSLLATITPGIIMLLLYELYILVLSTRGTFIGFIHVQFEIISLIILRDLFKKLDELSHGVTPHLLTELTVVAIGSIVLYFFVEILERIRHNLSFAAYEEKELARLTWTQRGKRGLRILLGTYFFFLVLAEGIGWLAGIPGTGFDTRFLTLVFGGLIVYNVLMLFAVLLISNSYETLFEHSALVLASSVVLVSLRLDPVVAIPLIVGALLFVIATLMLHGFARGASIRSLMKVAVKTKGKPKDLTQA